MTRLLQTYLLFIVCCMLASCYDEPWERGDIDGYAPIYSTDATLKQISFQPPRKTVNGGKLFTAGTNVLQEEIDSGLHVISYQDPAHPVKTGFLRIPGFQVAAIEGDYLYANNYNDLIAIPLKALSANMTVGRAVGAWKQLDYPAGERIYFECVDPAKGVVIGWRKAKVHNPQCRKPLQLYDDAKSDDAGRDNAGLVVLHEKLYLANPEALVMYSLSSPGQPVVVKSHGLSGPRADSIFLLNNELAIAYATQLYRYDTASLDDISFYNSLSYCLKVTAKGDTAYTIASQKNLCGGPSSNMLQLKLRKDSTGVVEISRLQVGMANAFVIAGSYIYVATEQGMAIVNIAGATLESAGDLFIGNYSDIVAKGSLLFLQNNQEIACYSIAASPVAPMLISKLPY